jgi:hypothetical protein
METQRQIATVHGGITKMVPCKEVIRATVSALALAALLEFALIILSSLLTG